MDKQPSYDEFSFDIEVKGFWMKGTAKATITPVDIDTDRGTKWEQDIEVEAEVESCYDEHKDADVDVEPWMKELAEEYLKDNYEN